MRVDKKQSRNYRLLRDSTKSVLSSKFHMQAARTRSFKLIDYSLYLRSMSAVSDAHNGTRGTRDC